MLTVVEKFFVLARFTNWRGDFFDCFLELSVFHFLLVLILDSFAVGRVGFTGHFGESDGRADFANGRQSCGVKRRAMSAHLMIAAEKINEIVLGGQTNKDKVLRPASSWSARQDRDWLRSWVAFRTFRRAVEP